MAVENAFKKRGGYFEKSNSNVRDTVKSVNKQDVE